MNMITEKVVELQLTVLVPAPEAFGMQAALYHHCHWQILSSCAHWKYSPSPLQILEPLLKRLCTAGNASSYARLQCLGYKC